MDSIIGVVPGMLPESAIYPGVEAQAAAAEMVSPAAPAVMPAMLPALLPAFAPKPAVGFGPVLAVGLGVLIVGSIAIAATARS